MSQTSSERTFFTPVDAGEPPKPESIEAVTAEVRHSAQFVEPLYKELEKRIVGQHNLVERLLIGLLSNGHVLLEGLPGLAKTSTVNALADAIDGTFQRIQFTPDLLPADLIGTLVFNPTTAQYTTHKGPLFANIILADEINRAPAKVQSALLEAMQEHQVTIGDAVYPLPEPFLVLATQNPIEQEGTYPLPEAQMDRFMMKVVVGYPSEAEEMAILERMSRTRPNINVDPVISPQRILELQGLVDRIYCDEQIKKYVIRLVLATRDPASVSPDLGHYVRYGASPRATINLPLAARAHAFLQGRGYVIPDDVKAIAVDVLRHRILVTYEAAADEVSREDIVSSVLKGVEVP
ncbi:MAG: AAA family ATPase [Opitutales bacterium]